MYVSLVVAIQKSIINYIDLILIKVTKQSKEKTGLIKKKRRNSGLLLESRDRLVTRPQSADHGGAALLSAPGALCVSGRWEGTHQGEQKDARTRFFFVIYLAIGRIWHFEFFENCFPSLVQRLQAAINFIHQHFRQQLSTCGS